MILQLLSKKRHLNKGLQEIQNNEIVQKELLGEEKGDRVTCVACAPITCLCPGFAVTASCLSPPLLVSNLLPDPPQSQMWNWLYWHTDGFPRPGRGPKTQ